MKKLVKTAIISAALVIGASLAACGTADDEPQTQPSREFVDNAIVPRGDEELRETAPQLSVILPDEEVARVTTNHGNIYIRFFPAEAPLAVESFLGHARDGFYDGTIFHRVQDGFMIQGGCPDGLGTGGTTIWGEDIAVESSDNLVHLRGALSMANTGARYSTGSQFFIVQCSNAPMETEARLRRLLGEDLAAAYIEYGGGSARHLDGRHTVFGQVFRGMDIVDRIAAVDVMLGPGQQEGAHPTRPVEDVVIISIEIMPYSEIW